MKAAVPKPLLSRLPTYLELLYKKKASGITDLSSTVLAEELNLNPIMVRKDLAATGAVGRPKTGFSIDELIQRIVQVLGYDQLDEAVLVGAGRLGKALLAYEGFAGYGMLIAAAFDNNESVIGQSMNGKPVYSLSRLPEILNGLQARIGIITVPAPHAQAVCDLLIDNGIQAIWNFAPVHLKVPESILVHNENMAASLALLSQHLQSVMRSEVHP